jgi:hypothetical protein
MAALSSRRSRPRAGFRARSGLPIGGDRRTKYCSREWRTIPQQKSGADQQHGMTHQRLEAAYFRRYHYTTALSRGRMQSENLPRVVRRRDVVA